MGVRNICQSYTKHAEAEAARFGVLLARRLGFSKIVLEIDALNVAQAIKTEATGSAPIFLIYEDIKLYKQMFEDFSCNHVKRSGNAIAHLIARWNCDDCNEYVRVCSFPQSILTLAGQASQLDYRVSFLGLAVVLLVASSKTCFLVFLRFPPQKNRRKSVLYRYSSILSDNASGSSVHGSSERRKGDALIDVFFCPGKALETNWIDLPLDCIYKGLS
ncbi:Mitogen-activated protein kinase kinase 9 [Bienertia sinuspersici]